MSDDWTETSKVQRSAAILGLGGLIPFWSLPVILLANGTLDPQRSEALLSFVALYGAIICSFMGGTRWGLAMRTPEAGPFSGLLGSVVPPLVAWAVVGAPDLGLEALDSPLVQLELIVGLLAFQLFEDWRSATRGTLSRWYIRLRMILVAGVTAPLILALLINGLNG
ncbi:MAG: DUF3429 domain-containing protein [Pseudomonadota bacterium]